MKPDYELVDYHDVDGNTVPAVVTKRHPDGSADLHVFHPTHGRVPQTKDDGDPGNSWKPISATENLHGKEPGDGSGTSDVDGKPVSAIVDRDGKEGGEAT